jgi:arsenite methyltransferase
MRIIAAVQRRVTASIVGQLGRPHGLVGRVVAMMLNRGNRWAVASAVDLSAATRGEAAADIGFGGGVGLSLLLNRVGDSGVVHGVDISADMLARARSGYSAAVRAGRLVLTEGSLTDLPLDDSSLDVAITVNTLYFVADLHRAFTEVFRVLRPGGRLVVGVVDPDLQGRLPGIRDAVLIRPIAEIGAAIENAGFDHAEHHERAMGRFRFHLLEARR